MTKGRNDRFRKIYDSTDCYAEVMCEFDDEQAAFKKEVEMISLYKTLGFCEANFTGGGEGMSNISEEVRQKIRLSVAKNPPKYWLGKRMPEAAKLKMRLAKIGTKRTREANLKTSISMTGKNSPFRKRVVCIETGLVYETATEAAQKLGFKKRTLCAQLSGQNKNTSGLTYENQEVYFA